MDFLEKAIARVQNDEIELLETAPESLPQADKTVDSFVYTQTKVIVPNNDILNERRVVALQKYNPMADLFRMLRTRVLKQLRTNNWNSFAVTSSSKGAGKSMIAVNLAISMAMEVNQTVLLVDFDLRYPKLHWYFDMDTEYGILDYIQSDVPLSKILVNPGVERLVVLPGKGQTKATSDIISAPKMKQLIADIKQRYASRIVIFDMPPVLLIDDVIAAMEYYDAALLVVEEGASKPDELKKTLQLLSNTKLLGMVLNKSEHLPEHQGYY